MPFSTILSNESTAPNKLLTELLIHPPIHHLVDGEPRAGLQHTTQDRLLAHQIRLDLIHHVARR